MSYDDDVVYAAAWLHDLGVFIGHRPEDPEALSRWDNVSYAMKQAPAALPDVGSLRQKLHKSWKPSEPISHISAPPRWRAQSCAMRIFLNNLAPSASYA